LLSRVVVVVASLQAAVVAQVACDQVLWLLS